ncbi:hypothetical protein QBC47DRAFT_387451 [Echria macrotheca]|uniref:Uncharacterized protein n=1 Tax=Echria macrotheca TaxID=438768 RepID=A0AAJ0B769_9PEZI|nr:hypothetical protein QBC47DRAFT_387451 [Echria macrotheca]
MDDLAATGLGVVTASGPNPIFLVRSDRQPYLIVEGQAKKKLCREQCCRHPSNTTFRSRPARLRGPPDGLDGLYAFLSSPRLKITTRSQLSYPVYALRSRSGCHHIGRPISRGGHANKLERCAACCSGGQRESLVRNNCRGSAPLAVLSPAFWLIRRDGDAILVEWILLPQLSRPPFRRVIGGNMPDPTHCWAGLASCCELVYQQTRHVVI